MTKQALRDRTHTITHDLVVGHTYEVAVVAVGMDGTKQAIEDAPKNAITIMGKETTPNPPSELTASGFLNSITLAWSNPTNYDYDHTEIWRATTNDKSKATKIAEVRGLTFIDTIGYPDITRYYWIRAVNTSGKYSTYQPNTTTGVSATSLGVAATDIDDFAITATKMFTNTIVLSGDSWINNSPGAGSVAWNTHTVVYNGASYPIVAGSTSSAYIYWTIGDTLYTGSATHPVLGNDAFMVAINTSGTHTLVWNSSANMVIGTAFIADLAVTNAKVNDLSASKLTAGTIDASVITVTNLNASNISTGTLTGRIVQTAASGGRIVLNPAVGAGFDMYNAGGFNRFYIRLGGADDGDVYCGDGTQGWIWDNSQSKMTISGTLTIKEGSSGIANTDAGDLALKDTVAATDCDTTIISGGKIITGLLTADNIQAGTLTGRTVQTASSSTRIILNSSDNTIKMFRGAEADECILIDDTGVIGGPRIVLGSNTYPYGSFYVGDSSAQHSELRHDYLDMASAVSAVPMVCLKGLTGCVYLLAGKNNAGTITSFIDPTGLFASAVGYRVAGVQVVGARVVDARCDDTINCGDATTDGVIDSLRDAMITHGLIAAS